jgi:hypothetical protein
VTELSRYGNEQQLNKLNLVKQNITGVVTAEKQQSETPELEEQQ